MTDVSRGTYLSLWVLAAAFGWIEGAVVVYLRDIHGRETGGAGVGFPLVSLPERLVLVEVVREACTLFVLAAAAWLTSRRWASRLGAFLLLFGVWDLTYYAVLRLVLGWPQSLNTWDILFLIPLPWVAPVWAPATVAVEFVVIGSYLFWTADRPRHYGLLDAAVLLASALTVIWAFTFEWRTAAQQNVPESFPVWLYWAGVVAGTSWFVHAEWRDAAPGP